MIKDPEQLKKDLVSLWEFGFIQQQMVRKAMIEISHKNHTTFLALKVVNDALVNILDELKEIIEKDE